MTNLGDTPYAQITNLMDRLRKDCPWDSQQSFETIAPYTIEESYEVADAIERGNMAELKTELGDLLFQVLFHSKLASEIEAFDFTDVCEALVEKMVRRHPHVFEGGEQPDWDTIKAAERKTTGETRTLDGVAKSLPALMRAEKLQKRAAKRGFDWPDTDGPVEKLREEIEEVSQAVIHQDQTEIVQNSRSGLITSKTMQSQTSAAYLSMKWKTYGRPPRRKAFKLRSSLYGAPKTFLHLTQKA